MQAKLKGEQQQLNFVFFHISIQGQGSSNRTLHLEELIKKISRSDNIFWKVQIYQMFHMSPTLVQNGPGIALSYGIEAAKFGTFYEFPKPKSGARQWKMFEYESRFWALLAFFPSVKSLVSVERFPQRLPLPPSIQGELVTYLRGPGLTFRQLNTWQELLFLLCYLQTIPDGGN